MQGQCFSSLIVKILFQRALIPFVPLPEELRRIALDGAPIMRLWLAVSTR